ncbi:MAG: hypothetical protein ACI4XH_00420 [Acutalibacteraceae bacterium]
MIKKVLAFVVALALVGTGIYFAFFHKTDEDKIIERLEAFETAYATGDFDGCLECLDAKSRNALKGIGSLGSVFGVDSDAVKGMFSLGVAIEDEQVKFKVKRIVFVDDSHAQVTADVRTSADAAYKESTSQVDFEMVKENNDWYMVEEVSLF